MDESDVLRGHFTCRQNVISISTIEQECRHFMTYVAMHFLGDQAYKLSV